MQIQQTEVTFHTLYNVRTVAILVPWGRGGELQNRTEQSAAMTGRNVQSSARTSPYTKQVIAANATAIYLGCK